MIAIRYKGATLFHGWPNKKIKKSNNNRSSLIDYPMLLVVTSPNELYYLTLNFLPDDRITESAKVRLGTVNQTCMVRALRRCVSHVWPRGPDTRVRIDSMSRV